MQFSRIVLFNSITLMLGSRRSSLRISLKFKRISTCVALTFATSVFADEVVVLPEINVTAEKVELLPSLSYSELNGGGLMRLRSNTSDTARLLDDQPGVSLYGAGGVSSMPVIHGLADDRVRVKVDGMDLISACANHMNPPLSYIDPANVGSVKVYAGITPVSVGGDSLGGTIIADSAKPEFSESEQDLLFKGQTSAFYRSNNNAQGVNLSATVAGEFLSMRYTSSAVSAHNYRAGGNFKSAMPATSRNWLSDGAEVGSSGYQSQNQAQYEFRETGHNARATCPQA